MGLLPKPGERFLGEILVWKLIDRSPRKGRESLRDGVAARWQAIADLLLNANIPCWAYPKGLFGIGGRGGGGGVGVGGWGGVGGGGVVGGGEVGGVVGGRVGGGGEVGGWEGGGGEWGGVGGGGGGRW